MRHIIHIPERFVDIHGHVFYNPNCTDWNNNPTTVDKEHSIWKSPDFNPETSHAIYCDRMWQGNAVAYYAAVRTVWPEKPQRQMFDGITPEEANMLLNLYFGHEVKLTNVLTGKNAMNGYPYWVFGYELLEKPAHSTVTMRTVVTNTNKKSIEVPIVWNFPDFKSAQADMQVLAKNTCEVLNASVPADLNGKFRVDDADDIVNIIEAHEAAIFYGDASDPVAIFDIFGLAEIIDKYGCKNWYYRGYRLRTNQKDNRIYVLTNKMETLCWRSDLNRALTYIDELLLKKQLEKAGV